MKSRLLLVLMIKQEAIGPLKMPESSSKVAWEVSLWEETGHMAGEIAYKYFKDMSYRSFLYHK